MIKPLPSTVKLIPIKPRLCFFFSPWSDNEFVNSYLWYIFY